MDLNAKSFALAVAAALSSASMSVQAALFDCTTEPGYCIGEGDTVIFRFAGTESAMGLFGSLQVIGDSIVSFPTEFRAESSTSTLASINDNGTVQVIAKPGYSFDSVTIVERGVYSMTGANSSVNVTAYMEVADWNDQLFGAYAGSALTLSPTTPLTNRTGTPTSWRMSGTIDMTANEWASVGAISLGLVNNLYATGNDGIAWIEKLATGAGLDVSIVTTPVPVPAAAWLLASGLLGLTGVARRRHMA